MNNQLPDPQDGKHGPVQIKEIGTAAVTIKSAKLTHLVEKGVVGALKEGKFLGASPSARLLSTFRSDIYLECFILLGYRINLHK